MAAGFSILDCTLRDGGYYTDWDFSPELVSAYLAAMAEARVDTVELGYVSPGKPGYAGRYFYLNHDALASARTALEPTQRIAVMINAKEFSPEIVRHYFGPASGLDVDLVRMAVSPQQLPLARELTSALTDCGIPAAVNVMYLSRYWDDPTALLPLRDARLEVVSLVDSFGACFPHEVRQAVAAARAALPGQRLGFHAHDNLSLAFANALVAVESGVTMLDGTVLGMGRGAGNLRTELLISYRDKLDSSFDDCARLSELIERLTPLQQRHGWGTSLPYMVAGLNQLHQGEIMQWLAKRRYTMPSILNSLNRKSNQAVDDVDYPPLNEGFLHQHGASETTIIVGGGDSAAVHADAILKLAHERRALLLHSSLRSIGHYDRSYPRMAVCLVGHEARRIPPAREGSSPWTFVVSPPPRFDGTVPDTTGQVFQASPFGPGSSASLGLVTDVNPLSHAIGAALAVGSREILLAGFDGYEQATPAQQALAREIEETLHQLTQRHSDIRIASLTPTLYQVAASSVYGLLADASARKRKVAAHEPTAAQSSPV